MSSGSTPKRSAQVLTDTLSFLSSDENRIALAEYAQESFSALTGFLRQRIVDELGAIAIIDDPVQRQQALLKAVNDLSPNVIVMTLGYLYHEKLFDLSSLGFDVKGGKVVGFHDHDKPIPKCGRSLDSGKPEAVPARTRARRSKNAGDAGTH